MVIDTFSTGVRVRPSDSEESRPVRTRYPTVRYADQAPTPQRSRLLLRKRKRVQLLLSQLEELKRQDRASEPDLSEFDPADTRNQVTDRFLTTSSVLGSTRVMVYRLMSMDHFDFLPHRLFLESTR